MGDNEFQDSTAPVPTEFGKMLRIERSRKSVKNAEKMAEALGITPSMLSEIENGKKAEYPDIDFLIRCRDFFGWKVQEGDSEDIKREKITKTLELFEKGLLNCENISLNMKYFHGVRRELLIKSVLTLLFIPDQIPVMNVITKEGVKLAFEDQIEKAGEYIVSLYELLKMLGTKKLELNDLPSPPVRRKVIRNRKGKQSGSGQQEY